MSRKMLIAGELRDGALTLDVINPATGQVLEVAPRASKEQLEEAVAAAKAAFPSWSALTPEERGGYLLKLADAVEAKKDVFARLLTMEQGKPLAQAANEVIGAYMTLRGYSKMRTPTKTLKENDKQRVLEHRTPLGVVAAIAPWNFPFAIIMGKIAPALISGNTVVAKPAPTTPLTLLMFSELAADILPAGVLNTIIDENDLGALLSNHPDIAKVSFTGSTATGKKVLQSGADSLKRVTLELGGNDAALVLDDADVEKIAPALYRFATLNAGQVCIAIKRIYAPRSKYDALVDAIAKLADATVVDDGLSQGAEVGPVQNKMQFEKLKEFLEDARATGKIVAGGEVVERDGYFIRPTIVRDAPQDSKIVKEEQFGPILPIIAYDDLDEAIKAVNDSEYGLGGSVWSSNVERAAEVAMKIDSGSVWVNKHLDLQFDVPFGGAKQSGMGREQGQEGLEEYTQAKIVNISLR